MKKLVPWLFASAAVMLMLPALAVRLVNADGGMAVCLALFFIVDPLFSVCIGVYAGRDIQRLWCLPIFRRYSFCSVPGCFWMRAKRHFFSMQRSMPCWDMPPC